MADIIIEANLNNEVVIETAVPTEFFVDGTLRGPQGDPGPQGPTGAVGPTGPIGLTGSTGPQGIQGIQGIAGVAGADGATGPAGSTGPTGPAGSGSGDMLKATYDPTNINGSAFARANHTGTQLAATISDFSSATAATASVTANTAKITNATHTGDVTGATTLTIAANAVTNAKMATMATKTYKGNTTGATAVPTDVPVATLKSDLALNNVDNTSNATERAATATLTNKRLTPRVSTTASSATPTASADTDDVYTVTALAAGATFGAPTGTPTNGQKLLYRIKDNATARTLAFNAIFRAIGVTLPTTTVISKTLYIATIYNSTDTKWDVVAVVQEV